MPFRVALSGLNASSADLNVTANNIANANTVGFKASRAEFADVFAVGAQAIGNGTRLAAVSQEFSQGGIDFTDRSLDLAISGEGFFTLSDNGVISYTRAGSGDDFLIFADSDDNLAFLFETFHDGDHLALGRFHVTHLLGAERAEVVTQHLGGALGHGAENFPAHLFRSAL